MHVMRYNLFINAGWEAAGIVRPLAWMLLIFISLLRRLPTINEDLCLY